MRSFKDYMALPKEERLYMDWGLSCRHVSGLGLKDGQRMRLRMQKDDFWFKARGFEMTLPKCEIKRVSLETEEWVDVYVPKFSNFKALIGVSTIGPLGLVLGWPTGKTREIKREDEYLVIETVDDSCYVFLCDKANFEFGDRQTPKKIVADFERGIGYAK